MIHCNLNFTPNYEQALGLLKHLNSEELTNLLNNEEKLSSMINDLQQVKHIETEKEMLIASNKSLSEFNLSQKPVLEGTRKQLVEVYSVASDLKKEFLNKKNKLEHVKSVQSPDTILALLQTATAEIEDETEEYVNKFLDGDTPINTFLEEYLEKRKLVHLRRSKSEKMALLLPKTKYSKSPPTRPPRASRQKPPAPPVPAVNKVSYSNSRGVPLVSGKPDSPQSYPNNSSWSPQASSVTPTRPAPQPPQKSPSNNHVVQGFSNIHISGASPGSSKPLYPAGSCSQPLITPYPIYPAAMPYPSYIRQNK